MVKTKAGTKDLREITASLYICFFLSGATGLIYEIVWTRELTLIFGSTVLAISTVLSAFMAGLSLGSFWGGRIVDRSEGNVLKMYAWIEGGIGLFALLMPFLFLAANYIYTGPLAGLAFYPLSLARFLVSFVLLLIPTTLMGATLPVISRFFISNLTGVGSKVGYLYGLNTLGAVLGSFGAGFIMLQIFGLAATTYLAAVINLGIAGLVISFNSRIGKYKPAETLPEEVEAEVQSKPIHNPQSAICNPQSAIRNRLILIGLGLSGLAGMVYEVTWTRILNQVLGSSVYTFSTMLTTFIMGIAAGSLLFARLFRHRRVSLSLFAAAEAGIGLSALLITYTFNELPQLFLILFGLVGQSYYKLLAAQFLIPFLVMIFPTLLMGATFPILAQIYTQSASNLGQSIGTLYAANTFGAILGAFAGGFLIIPFLGTQTGILLSVGINLVVGIITLMADQERRWATKALRAGITTGLAALFLIFLPPYDQQVASKGVAPNARKLTGSFTLSLKEQAHSTALLYFKEGLNCNVSVHKSNDGTTFLKVNGKTDASTGSDMNTQILLGYLPLFFHPDPEHVLVIGLGSGVTVGAAAAYEETRQVDCVEIEEAVVEAASFFATENHNCLDNPKVKIIVEDGRGYLLRTKDKYDCIISEPSNPWIAGVASLFTTEFYQLVQSRLKPDGIICQWIHGYSLNPRNLKLVIRTLKKNFPCVTIWQGSPNDYLILGSRKKLKIDYHVLKEKMTSDPVVLQDLKSIECHSPFGLANHFILTEEEVENLVFGNEVLNTDDLPLLEFSAPVSLYRETSHLNYLLLKDQKIGDIPSFLSQFELAAEMPAEFYYQRGRYNLENSFPEDAWKDIKKGLEVDSLSVSLLTLRGRYYQTRGLIFKALSDFKGALEINPDMAETHYRMAQIYADQEQLDDAWKEYQIAHVIKPEEREYRISLARILEKEKDYDLAINYYHELLRLKGDDVQSLVGIGRCYYHRRKMEEAERYLKLAIKTNPYDAAGYFWSGKVCLETGKFKEAAESFKQAVRLVPYSAENRLNFGISLAYSGRFASAREELKKTLLLDPGNFEAFYNLEMIAGK
ncbi:MAG: fused MFS/spermidine synthase [bacterium]|nr:fused MFS/spermidine synthase [bacterium]